MFSVCLFTVGGGTPDLKSQVLSRVGVPLVMSGAVQRPGPAGWGEGGSSLTGPVPGLVREGGTPARTGAPPLTLAVTQEDFLVKL